MTTNAASHLLGCYWRTAVVSVVVCVSSVVGSPVVLAGSVSGAMDVRLELQSSCNFTTTPRLNDSLLDFGRTAGDGVSAVEGAADATGSFATIGIACSSSHTGANAPVLTISYGLHAKDSQRYLLGTGDERIAYDLYADPARHVPLDPTVPLQLVIPVAGVTTVVSIYGRIPHIGHPLAGSYTDVVWLTLSY